MNDITFKDLDSCEISVDSYVKSAKRGANDDYAFVVLSYEPGRGMHTVGLTFDQAKNLAVFLIEELAK